MNTTLANSTPLTLEALTSGTIEVNIEDVMGKSTVVQTTGMKFSLNGGEKNLIFETTTININAGDKVQFYGNGTSTNSYQGTKIAGGTANVKAYGNIMSLIDETGYATLTTLPDNKQVFYGLSKTTPS